MHTHLCMVKEDVDWQHEEIDEEADAQKRGPAPQVDAVGEEELGVPPQVLLDLQVLVRVSDRHLGEEEAFGLLRKVRRLWKLRVGNACLPKFGSAGLGEYGCVVLSRCLSLDGVSRGRARGRHTKKRGGA